MFSPDNFYDYIDSCYGLRTGNTIMTFNGHGCKDFSKLQAWSIPGKRLGIDRSELNWPHPQFSADYGFLLMHDQEPFYLDSVRTYRSWCIEEAKHHAHFNYVTDAQNFLRGFWTCTWPIMCHSEVNSAEISWAENLGLIPCHYFYHGMISRDWFRHWRHAPEPFETAHKTHRFLLYARDHSGTRQYRERLKDRLRGCKDLVLCHTWNADHPITADYSAKVVLQDAQRAHIHIVTETIFADTKIHLTEKVFKAMVMRQPFVLFAAPGSLEYLKKYGFRTFAEIWDESYDLETDTQTRFEKLVSLIQYLNELDQDEFSGLMQRCQLIIEHNHRHFFSDRFESIMLDELHGNISFALQQQQARRLSDPGGSYLYVLDQYHRSKIPLHPGLQNRLSALASWLKRCRHDRWQQICLRYDWLDLYAK